MTLLSPEIGQTGHPPNPTSKQNPIRRHPRLPLGTLLLTSALMLAGAPSALALDWTVQTAGGLKPSLTFVGGLPRVAYVDSTGAVKVAVFDGSAWLAGETVTASGGQPSLARNPVSGQLQVSYVNNNSDVFLATRGVASWVSEQCTTNQPVFDPSGRSPILAVAANGQPHIAFGGPLQNGNADYSYATKIGGNWQVELVEGPGQPFSSEYSALALNTNGIPAIVYNCHTNGSFYRTKFTTRSGGTWSPPEVVFQDINVPGTALKYDQNNVPHAVWIDGGVNLIHATRNSSGVWLTEVAATNQAPGVFTIALALHPATGAPYISFGGNDSANSPVKVAYRQGSVWAVDTLVASATVHSTAIAIDEAGTTLGVAYNGKYAFATITTNLVIVTSAALPPATVGQPYSNRLEAINGVAPLTWNVASGGLPGGLTLGGANGVIAGTPGSALSTNFTIQVAGANGSNATRAFTLTVNPVPAITTSALATGSVGVLYHQPLTASGGTPPLIWTVTTGTFPAGLNLDGNSGTITGTPNATATVDLTLQARDANGAIASRTLSLQIKAQLAITTASPLAPATVGAAINRAIAITGGVSPFTWTLASGALPNGVTLNSGTGALLGAPTDAGQANFNIQVADAASGLVNKDFSVLVNLAPIITTTDPLLSGNVGSPYSQTLAVIGGTAPLTWSEATGNLPTGISLAGNSGLLSGTPSVAGSNQITFQATDANGAAATKTLTLVIYQGANVTNGLALYASRCATCHGTPPAGVILRGASRVRLETLATGAQSHTGGAGPFANISLSDVAAYLSSRDSTTYSAGGRVTNAAGAGISSVQVRASSTYLSYGFPIEYTTSGDGSYTLYGLPAGDHVITPVGGGHRYTPGTRLASVYTGAATLNSLSFLGTATAPPVVSLTSPATGSGFTRPANVQLAVNASDSDGTIAQVEYFAGTKSLGIATGSPFGLVWTNPTFGSYMLRAEATDNNGAKASSGLVHITISTPYDPLASGRSYYQQSCYACHGSPPGANPGLGLLNSDILIAATKYVLEDGAVVQIFSPHTNTVNSVTVSNFVHNLSDQSRTELAAYIASNSALYATHTLTGRVETTDFNGTGVAGVAVYLDGYNPRQLAITDANGNFAFTGLMRGDYTVSLYHPSFAFAAYDQIRTITVGYGGQLQTVYATRNSSSVLGAIRNAGGAGLAGVTLTITGASTTNIVTTDADGLFSLNAQPGNYTITVAADSNYAFTPATRALTVASGGDAIANFSYVALVVRVSSGGNDANDGSSWGAAKRSIGAALIAAPPGGEVWVAAGIYYERITVQGRAVYGGFAGNETARAQRNWRTNISTLDGNPTILGQLGLTPGNMVMLDDFDTNTARLDGLSIINGRATSPSHGAGVHIISYSSPVIANCRISGNLASYGGGGIYCGGSSQAIITNNLIIGNSAQTGAGIYCDYGSTPRLIANNIIARNMTDGGGGGIGINGRVTLLANNTIVANVATNGGAGGLYCGFGSATNINNVIAFNSSGVYQDAIFTGAFHHNNVHGNTNFNYSGLTATNDVSANPLFLDFLADDYHLQFGSPCIDAGDNSAVAAEALDWDGQPRIQRARVDIGADEVPPPAMTSSRTASNLTLAWPAGETRFVLEYATDLSLRNWLPAPQTATTNGATKTVTIGITGTNGFYRLRQ